MSWLTAVLGIDKANKTAAGHAVIQPISDALKNLTQDGYTLLASTFHTNVATAVSSTLHAALVTGETEVAKVQASVLHAIVGTVGKVDSAQVPLITDAVNGAVSSAENWAEGAAEKVVPALLTALAAKLGI